MTTTDPASQGGTPMTTYTATVDDIIAAWPVIPEHADAEGKRCGWSGIISESGQCPDRHPTGAS